MNSDIRLQVGLFENVKIKKLHKRLGAEAVLSLLKLWIYVAVNNPNGVLDNFNKEDIDIICCWEHTDSILPVLIELVLVEKTETGFIIHDWENNNHWAANAEKRSEQARRAASVRWDKKQAKRTGKKTVENPILNADGMPTAMPNDANSNAPFLSFPFLSLPKEFKTSALFNDIWKEWEQYRKDKKSKLTELTIKRQIKVLTDLPVDMAIKCLELSIQNGWTGIFPEKLKNQPPPQNQNMVIR